MEEQEFNKEDFLAQLGSHIARLRRAKGYSQDRLCLEAGFARGTLSRIEAGLVDPCASTIARIADTLGPPGEGLTPSSPGEKKPRQGYKGKKDKGYLGVLTRRNPKSE